MAESTIRAVPTCLTGKTTPSISANGTYSPTTQTPGLTANHRVMRWGFSVGDENNPPADVVLTPSANQYSVVVTNYGGTAFTMTPVFILPQP